MISVISWVSNKSLDLQFYIALSILYLTNKFIVSIELMVAATSTQKKRKTTQKSSPKSKVSTKKTVSKSKKKTDTGVVKKSEKKELIDDLKTSVKSMWRLPGMIMAPVILFVNKRYESIPADRRKSLKNISKKLKTWSSDGLSHLKDWFSDTSKLLSKGGGNMKEKNKKATTKRKTVTKKTSRKTSKKKPIEKVANTKKKVTKKKVVKKS